MKIWRILGAKMYFFYPKINKGNIISYKLF